MVNKPLIRPYVRGGGWLISHDCQELSQHLKAHGDAAPKIEDLRTSLEHLSC